jgi:4,5-dihydroxyphthalate decarboxylase
LSFRYWRFDVRSRVRQGCNKEENVRLTLALSLYDRHVPFFDGTVGGPKGTELRVLQVGQSVPLRDGADRHERMIRDLEFDLCELSLSSYLMAKDRGLPLTAIPVFPRRLFSHSLIYVNADSGIRVPRDLIGKRVGLRSFQTTLSVLAKGDLQAEYGVPWKELRWFLGSDEKVPFSPKEGVSLQRIAAGKKLGAMLEEGEIDALIMPHPPKSVLQGSRAVRRLHQDPRGEELAYYRKNGFYPIMHVIAAKEELFAAEPWLAPELMKMFQEARSVCSQYYDDPNWSLLAWGRHYYEEERALLGEDLWPSGVAKNRKNLERFIEYSFDQGLIDRKMEVEKLFAAPVRSV